MKVIIVLVLFAIICSSKCEQKLEALLKRICSKYDKEYNKTSKAYLQDEDIDYPPPPPNGGSAVNGRNAFPGSYPYMAALGYTTKKEIDWACGGTLISKQYVLTAAHCLKRSKGSKTEEVEWVRLGVVKLSGKYGAYPKDYKVIERIAHPSYEPPSKYNDVGLIKLDKPIEISKYIRPNCLTTQKEFPFSTYTSYTAAGWGLTRPYGNKSDILQYVELEIYPEKECNEAYNNISPSLLKNGVNQDQQICLGSDKIRTPDTCQGDSGGPLNANTVDDKYNTDSFLYGITAFGKSCGLQNIPGIYMRVSYYVPWIKNIVWPNEK